jgi:diacylglycerol kinase family enzyme
MTCNNQYTGNGMKIAPDASMDDGKMDVVIMKAQSRFKLFILFLQVFSGKHIYHPDILYQKAERIRIEPSSQMILNIDGQQTGRTPVNIKVLPKQVDIFI